ncbi:hypothetical protein OG828_44790 [Streptomyces sp. NBC_00457]|uniref:hypothetical protein n=1 Tax=Streptomyces sp. NBC_00457 TaxID=2975748 RepID=UPI002E1ED217
MIATHADWVHMPVRAKSSVQARSRAYMPTLVSGVAKSVISAGAVGVCRGAGVCLGEVTRHR